MAKKPAKDAGDGVISLKVTLRNTKPPIWRRLLAPAGMTLADLHDAIQAAMGWDGGHLHVFDIDGEPYGDPAAVDDAEDENRLTLGALRHSGLARFRYTYDFGDDWEHAVTIEKSLPAGPGTSYPRCVAGKRACPPEDCGGPWGYQELLDILADPSHPERAERLEWIGGEELHPEEFSIDEANRKLAARFGHG